FGPMSPFEENLSRRLNSVDGRWKASIQSNLHDDLHHFLFVTSHVPRSVNMCAKLRSRVAQCRERGNSRDLAVLQTQPGARMNVSETEFHDVNSQIRGNPLERLQKCFGPLSIHFHEFCQPTFVSSRMAHCDLLLNLGFQRSHTHFNGLPSYKSVSAGVPHD